MRRLLLSLLACLVLGASPASAANQTVSASDFKFTPSVVTIAQGESVTWTNAGGTHNVHFDDGFRDPAAPDPSMWTVSRTFTQPGTFRYVCDFHEQDGMIGTVTVTAPGGAPPGQPPPGVTPKDTAKPVASISSRSKQDVDKLYVKASMNEAGRLSAAGTITVPRGAAKVYRFKTATRSVTANKTVKLRLKLSKKSLRAVKRALRHRKLRAKIRITAKDPAGNSTVTKRTIRLKR